MEIHAFYNKPFQFQLFYLLDLFSLYKDTVINFSSVHLTLSIELQLNELSKSTWVVVVNSFCISKGFHDGTVQRINHVKKLQDWQKPSKWPIQNFSLQYQYNIKQTSDESEKKIYK